ncbi:hypothetical protein CMO93_02185 [Candidatus Woesearchaeota archaeon]|nr:hypothetical protein [Candidatus Woesearchaeota archaeon]|tara:strand:+ start:250 stop:633 length:384 start_codon:yes stop_codon:yes gene_type:complete
MDKSKKYYYFKIVVFVIIIIVSAIITKSVKEAYPSLIIDYDTTEEQHLLSKLDGTNTFETESFIQDNTFIKGDIVCTSDTFILYPDETRINEGDLMVIKAFWMFEEGEQSYWAGVHPEELVNVKPGN